VEPLKWDGDPPALRSPILVAAFAGWNDAAGAATTALDTIAGSLDADPIAELDPEEFYDFQVTRPTIRLTDGQTREVDWPENAVLAAPAPAAERDLVLLSGIEPNTRWRTFAAAVLEVAERLEVELVVTLGALLADVPHSRPSPVTGAATDQHLVDELGLQLSRYEGPTGIVGVLHAAFADAGLPAASLWAAVPHYVAVAPNPKGALALLRRLESLVGVTVDATELEDAAADYERQVSRAVELDPDVQAFIERLERAADEETGRPDPGSLPSGDVLAREFQRFLRQRGTGPGQ
jgi:proteasome assembly chaperone (PAC2) family protein